MAGRGCFTILPLVTTLATLVITLLAFFGSYKSTLTSVYLMQIDLSNVTVSGTSVTSAIESAGIYSYYQVGINGYCYGSNSSVMEGCSTPTTPYWFNLTEILSSNSTTASTLIDDLPSKITEYQNIVKACSYAMWACLVIVMVLSGVIFVFGILSICTPFVGCCVSIFAGLMFFLSFIGAGIATGMFKVYSSKFNDTLDSFGASAELGRTGVILLWVAVACALLTQVMWSLTSCCCVTSRRRVAVDEVPMAINSSYAPVYNHSAPAPAAGMYYREDDSAHTAFEPSNNPYHGAHANKYY